MGRLNGLIYTSGPGGEAYFQIGDQAGNYDTISNPHIGPVPPGGDFLIYEDWGFDPGRSFHWRLCYLPSGGPEVCGADRVFQAPPDTLIGAVEVARKKATISFASSPVANMTVTFQCKLDGRAYAACNDPKRYRNLKRGKHSVSVRAVAPGGFKDTTPAKETFRIRR